MTKLVLAEHGHERARLQADLVGPDAFLEGDGGQAAFAELSTRAMSIAGGTSEITRNQIAERILGFPRDPLIIGAVSPGRDRSCGGCQAAIWSSVRGLTLRLFVFPDLNPPQPSTIVALAARRAGVRRASHSHSP